MSLGFPCVEGCNSLPLSLRQSVSAGPDRIAAVQPTRLVQPGRFSRKGPEAGPSFVYRALQRPAISYCLSKAEPRHYRVVGRQRHAEIALCSDLKLPRPFHRFLSLRPLHWRST